MALPLALVALVTAFGWFAAGPTPSPLPSAATSPPPRKDAAPRVHRAMVDCDQAAFYSWPAQDTIPSPASYPSARIGEVFDVLGDARISFDGKLLYETTIDVVHPWGDGKHYWISARCVNAA